MKWLLPLFLVCILCTAAASKPKRGYIGVQASAGGSAHRVGYGMDGGWVFGTDTTRTWQFGVELGLIGGTDKYPEFVDTQIPHSSYRTLGPYLTIEMYMTINPALFVDEHWALEATLGLTMQEFQYVDKSTVTGENWDGGSYTVEHGCFGGGVNYYFDNGNRLHASYATRRGGVLGFSWGLL